jgi:hypothetical protein
MLSGGLDEADRGLRRSVAVPEVEVDDRRRRAGMDKKALKILFSTYWSSSGWKADSERLTPPDDLRYATQAGLMFDPIRLSHGDIVRRAIEVRTKLNPQGVGGAFLASLSCRRLEIRSALGSYAVLRHLPPHEHHDPDSPCRVCGEYDTPDEDVDLNVLNFERFKWGGVRHDQPVYATFDLERFLTIDPPSPTDADSATFLGILRAIESVPPDTTVPRLVKTLAGLLPSNKSEREILINILGYTGILAVPDHAGYFTGFVPPEERELPPHRFADVGYPACWWKGRNGIDRDALSSWFPALEV